MPHSRAYKPTAPNPSAVPATYHTDPNRLATPTNTTHIANVAIPECGLMCTTCEMRFPCQDDLAVHMVALGHGTWHHCSTCGLDFVTMALLRNHVSNYHRPSGDAQQVGLASQYPTVRVGLERHSHLRIGNEQPRPHQAWEQQQARGAPQAAHQRRPHQAWEQQQARGAPQAAHQRRPDQAWEQQQYRGAPQAAHQRRPDQAWEQQQAREGIQQPRTGDAVPHYRKAQITEGESLTNTSKKTYDAIVKAFVEDASREHLEFPPTLTAEERHHIHKMCMHYGLEHASTGSGAQRRLRIWKRDFAPPPGSTSEHDPLVGRRFNGFTGVQPLSDQYLEDHVADVTRLVEGPAAEMQKLLIRRISQASVVSRRPDAKRGAATAWFTGNDPGSLPRGEEYQRLQQFRESLPCTKMRTQLVDKVSQNRVVVVSGDTGCGKTTQLPQLLYDAGTGKAICPEVPGGGMILCTQPRRVSAISVAQRVAQERGEKCGSTAGYAIRFESVASSSTRILYLTTGILLRRLHTDPELRGVAVVILDEVHERDVETDFALLLLRDLIRSSRSRLHLVVMSATIQIEKLVQYFSEYNPPLVSIPGSLFPVTEYWLDDAMQWLNLAPEAVPAMVAAVEAAKKRMTVESHAVGPQSSSYETLKTEALENLDKKALETVVPIDVICGVIEAYHRNQPKTHAILVFLPGWAAIDKVMNALRSRGGLVRELSILPLHSTLTTPEQQRVFLPAPKNFRKVVLATNIAETSITIDDVVLVIDSGLLKGTSYDVAGNTSSLTSQLISKANGQQRRGRAGRVRAGVCVHLLPKATYQSLPDFLLPEMQRTPLEEICLQVKAIVDAPCVELLSKALDPPPATSVRHAVSELTAMGALDFKERLTPLGRILASFPLHPALGKMLLLGASLGVFDPMCTLAASLSGKTPFLRGMPHQASEVSAAMHKFCAGRQSDHLAILELYAQWCRSVRRGDFASANWADHTVLIGMERMRAQLRRLVEQSGFLRSASRRGWENRYSTNEALIRFTLAQSLHPKLAVYERDIKNRQNNLHCWDNKPCTFQMSSCMARTKLHQIGGCEFFVYYERMRIESQLQLFDTTSLSRTTALLAAKSLDMVATRSIHPDAKADAHAKFRGWDEVTGDVDTLLPMTLEMDEGKKRFAVTRHVAEALIALHDTVNFFFSLALQRMQVDAVPDSVTQALAVALGQPAKEAVSNGSAFAVEPRADVRLGPSSDAFVPYVADSDEDDALDEAPVIAGGDAVGSDSTESITSRKLTPDEVDILVRAFGDLSWIMRHATESQPAIPTTTPQVLDDDDDDDEEGDEVVISY